MRNTYIYIIGMAMALAPVSAWGQEPLSARTAIVAHSDNSTYSKGTSTGCNLHTAYVTIDTNKTSWRQLGLTPLASYGNTATESSCFSALIEQTAAHVADTTHCLC